jgi:hypothetical protein
MRQGMLAAQVARDRLAERADCYTRSKHRAQRENKTEPGRSLAGRG